MLLKLILGHMGDTGLTCAETEGSLRGQLAAGTPFQGIDTVKMVAPVSR